MNSEIKERWVEALRSGKYTQGRNQLRTAAGSYCCLGVLCDIIDPDGWEADGEVTEWIDHGADPDEELSTSNHLYLPYSLEKRIFDDREVVTDIEKPTGGYYRVEESRVGAILNDAGERTFEQIADFIEENL